MMTGQTDIPYAKALVDAAALFESLGIGYALVGGVAAMYHGRTRFTEDLDFVAVAGHMDLLSRNAEAMKVHHFDPGCTWKLYHDSGAEIDIWKDEHVDGVVARAELGRLAGREVRIADPHDLVAMKLRAGRLKDDYDISEVLRAKAIDDARVQGLVTPEQFAHFLEIRRRM